MRVIAVIAVLLFAAPATAHAVTVFDFTWFSQENAFGPNPNDPSFQLTGRSVATLSDAPFTDSSGNTITAGTFRFDGPGAGRFNGLYGGDLEKFSDGSYHGIIDFPSVSREGHDQGFADLTPTSTGFRVSATNPGSGPDDGSIFRGTMTRRTAQAPEPASIMVTTLALVGASVIRRRRRRA